MRPPDTGHDWLALTESPTTEGMGGPAADLLRVLVASGSMFPQNLPKAAALVPAHVEMGLAELLARGLITCDSFAALRQMITPPSRRRGEIVQGGAGSVNALDLVHSSGPRAQHPRNGFGTLSAPSRSHTRERSPS